MSLLEFKNVSFNNVLKDISFHVDSGEFISVVGPSGGGKSTLFKLAAHLISPIDGDIFFDGKSYLQYNPVELRQNIVYCFQTPYLFGRTVMDNLEFPYSIRNQEPDLSRIRSLFSLFHMSTDYLKKEVKNLSGGEKQRIALIRSIIFMPKILLLDEITSALDVNNTLLVEEAVASLHHEGITIMWITHNQEQSRKYADKLLTIDSGKIKSFEKVTK